MRRALKHGMPDVARVKGAIDRAYKANADRLSPYSPRMVWKGARAATVSMTVMTKTIMADIAITDDEVLLEGKVPFLFSHMEGRILNVLGEHLETWLAKARADEV